MKAHGLSDMIYAKAFLRKVLNEGISSSSTFANKLVDTRYREFAAAFNFATLGENATQTTAATSGTVGKYLRQALEEDAGQQNEGVRLALYFRAQGARHHERPIKFSPTRRSLKVVQTALGISSLTAMADVDKQAAMLTKKIDFTDFQNPEKLKTFLQRFSVDVGGRKRSGHVDDSHAFHPHRPADRAGNKRRYLGEPAKPEIRKITKMQSALYVSLSAQVSLEKRLETIANNMANMKTSGVPR